MDKQSVGIITIHNSPNYGASLQSFALYKFVEMLGYDCSVIDLARPTHADFIDSKNFRRLIVNKDKPIIKYVKNILHFLKYKERMNEKKINIKYESEIIRREKRFDTFNAQVKLTKRFCSVDELYREPPSFDTYLTGSDQVWNPYSAFAIEPYFLTFVKNNGNRVSYAPSIAISSLPNSLKPLYSKWLYLYNNISIREEEGKVIIAELIDKPVEVVLDPTFLHSVRFWQEIAIKPKFSKKYILCFILNRNEHLLSYACKASNELGLELVLFSTDYSLADSKNYTFIIDAGPQEFLGWVSNAEIVLTDSFHGTVFSILLGNNFFTHVKRDSKIGGRIMNLLKSFDLDNHLLDTNLTNEFKKLQFIHFNRQELNSKIALKSDKSKLYLINALKKE